MTEVQRATHPGGGSVTLSKVLTRRKDHGGNDHHRDGDEDASMGNPMLSLQLHERKVLTSHGGVRWSTRVVSTSQ